jgi:hypothetical protein
MRRYRHLASFGCSFTEGGGLNSPDHYKYLKEKNPLLKMAV